MFNERDLDLIIMMENNFLKGPSLLLKTYPLMKYYHKDTSLTSLSLLYDTSAEYKNIDTEIEQLLLKACMKEGYVILQKFMDQSPYYLLLLQIRRFLCIFTIMKMPIKSFIILFRRLKSMPSRHAHFILIRMLQYITDNTDLSV